MTGSTNAPNGSSVAQNEDLSAPLVVDLDGTLIKTDLLYETASQFSLRQPWRIFSLFIWLLRGPAFLKAQLAAATQIDVEVLPYNQCLLTYLREQRAEGRKLALATASHKQLAEAVADHLDLFDRSFSTEGNLNLRGEAKRSCLVDAYGEGGFDYVGNDKSDLCVWRSARQAYAVLGAGSFRSEVEALESHKRSFDDERGSVTTAFIKALRPHQWVKNLLLVVPLLGAHLYTDTGALFAVVIAFFVFSLTASSVYFLNDLADVQADRDHSSKSRRPFAAGNLSLLSGWIGWVVMALIALTSAWLFLPTAFGITLGIYFLVSLAYSLWLKQSAILDVIILAGLYTLRIIAGAAAISIAPSFWLLSFSMFLFLSLAFIKRYSELKEARESGHAELIKGRGYRSSDLEMVSSLGGVSGYLSVLVLALYIQDPMTVKLYQTPQLIWLACPVLLYWISRAWLITHRGEMHSDPIMFALKDRVSWVLGGLMAVVFISARVFS